MSVTVASEHNLQPHLYVPVVKTLRRQLQIELVLIAPLTAAPHACDSCIETESERIPRNAQIDTTSNRQNPIAERMVESTQKRAGISYILRSEKKKLVSIVTHGCDETTSVPSFREERLGASER